MARSWRHTIVAVQQLLDVFCVIAAFCVFFLAQNVQGVANGFQELLILQVTVWNVVLAALFVLVWRTVFSALGLYQLSEPVSNGRRAIRIVEACTVATAFLAVLPLATGHDPFELRVICYFWLTCVVVVTISRATISGLVRYVDKHVESAKRTIIVGSGPRALALFHALQRERSGRYEIVGFVDSLNDHPVPAEVQARMLGSLEALEGILVGSPIDRVLITLPVRSCYSQIQQTILTCERVGVESNYLSDVFALSLAKQRYDHEERFPLVTLQMVADDSRILVKRAIDLVGAIVCLILFSPILCLCALVVKVTSPGPVLFSQERCGLNRRHFRMYKFRTMVQGAEGLQDQLDSKNEAQFPVFKLRRDPRLTPVGLFLRKSSLDELPQLFNVLKGEMSLVGPRPLWVRDVSRFSESWLMRRFSVKPGLTCLWQVSGRSNTSFDRWVELDLEYIDNWSLLLDFKILLKTVPAVLSGTGAM